MFPVLNVFNLSYTTVFVFMAAVKSCIPLEHTNQCHVFYHACLQVLEDEATCEEERDAEMAGKALSCLHVSIYMDRMMEPW